MNKTEYLRILMLPSQLEGFIAGKIGSHTLPDYMDEELSEVCKLLATKIREN